jgi:hypothetical protein
MPGEMLARQEQMIAQAQGGFTEGEGWRLVRADDAQQPRPQEPPLPPHPTEEPPSRETEDDEPDDDEDDESEPDDDESEPDDDDD